MSMDPVKFPDGTLTPVSKVSYRQLYAEQRMQSATRNVQNSSPVRPMFKVV